MMATLKTQDWVVADGHLDLEVSYAEDPLRSSGLRGSRGNKR